jgi:PEP-CTERM motif
MKNASMKKIGRAVAFAGACMASPYAAAVDHFYDLGTLSVGATAFSGSIIHIGGPVTSFNDFYTFTLPANGGSAYSVINFPVPAFDLSLTFANLAVFSKGADNAIGGTGANADEMLVQDSGSTTSLSVSLPGSASSQDLYLYVSGFTAGTNGGLYSGAISVSPMPVPEPEVWAMMLVGAGLVGFRIRTKSKRASASRFA